MRIVRTWLGWSALVLGLVGAGCQCPSKDLSRAVGEFLEFGQGKTKDPIKPELKREYTIRTWVEDVHEGRSRARADVEIPVEADPEQLEGWLRDACHDPKLLRNTSAVRVWAWPGKLHLLGFPYGTCTFARDGRGWDGQGVGFEDIRVFLPSGEALERAGIRSLTEEEHLILLGVDNQLRRKIPREEALAQVAERHGIPPSRVQRALENADGLTRLLRDKAGLETAMEAFRHKPEAPPP
jgi:hypothetical protein